MPNDSYAVLAMCAERLKLSDIVAKAVQANYAAKDAHDQVLKSKKAASSSAVVLADARQAELAAVSALNRHREEHGC